MSVMQKINFNKRIIETISKIKLEYGLNYCKSVKTNYYFEVSSYVKDIFNYSKKKVYEQYMLETENKSIIKLSSNFLEESANILFKSNYIKDDSVQVKFIKNSKNEKETNLEIWNESILVNSIKLEDFGITRVYFDDIFGKPKFSPDGKQIIFLAEKDVSRKFKNYFDSSDSSNSDGMINLDKFKFTQDFGENLKDKTTPQIYNYNIEKNKIYHLNLDNYPNIYPTHPQFDYTNRDIVFSGLDLPDLKLGLVYCMKRKSSIFLIKNPNLCEVNNSITLSENNFINNLINLSPLEYTNIIPIFSPNFDYLVWFSNEDATPHNNGLKLYSIDWTQKRILDQSMTENSQNYISISSKLIIDKINKENPYFNGIYSSEDKILQNKFLSEHIFVFTSNHRNTMNVYLYDLINNNLFDIPFETSSNSLIEIKDNLIFTNNSDIRVLPQMKVTIFNLELYEKILKNKDCTFDEKNLGSEQIILENGVTFLKIGNLFSTTNITKNNLYLNEEIQSLKNILDNIVVEDLKLNNVHGHFSYVTNSKYCKSPLVYFIHGGPNSVLEKSFLNYQFLFLALGYSVLIVNYPGSVGFGQDYLQALNGKIGSLDVESCGEFLKSFLLLNESNIDNKNIFLFGGSHGGYLSCWLTVHEKYCKMFRAAAVRNPVTDLVSMMATSDIPDWILGQATNENLNYSGNYPPSMENYKKFYKASPVYYIKNACTPFLFLLGKIDRRVNWFNGLYFYEALRKNNSSDNKLLVYPEDNHSLSSLETEVDSMFNVCNWFGIHLLINSGNQDLNQLNEIVKHVGDSSNKLIHEKIRSIVNQHYEFGREKLVKELISILLNEKYC